MVESVRRITNVTDIPVFADADTGYGNAVNVHYTVKAYIRAGAAGLHIEDQESPKKSGTLAGRRLISREEAVGKYRAAVAAKKELDPDFVICARCDSIGSEGGNFEDAVQRSVAYVKEASVDAIWVNTLTKREEIEEACRRIPAPVIAPTMARGRHRRSKNFRNSARRRFYIRVSPRRTACKRPGNCSTNSKNAVQSCSRSGTKKRSRRNGAWCRARKIRFYPPRRFVSSKRNSFRKSCNATMTKPLGTIGIELQRTRG